MDNFEKGEEAEPFDGELIVALRCSSAEPYHPREATVCKLTLIGAKGVGKSAIAQRLVTHAFEPRYRPTRERSLLYWRHHEEDRGRDLLVELEDTPGIEAPHEGTTLLQPSAQAQLSDELSPLVWFEKRHRARPGRSAATAAAGEAAPLLGQASSGAGGGGAAGAAWMGGSERRVPLGVRLEGTWGLLLNVLSGERWDASLRRPATEPSALASSRKRMGFVVVADVSSRPSFDAAFAIIDAIFGRLQFDVTDAIACPVALVLVGNKSDLRGARRDPRLGSEALVREQVEQRYQNIDLGIANVSYLECSASANTGIEEIVLQSLLGLSSSVPNRARIRASRLRVRGRLGALKRRAYTMAPLLFDAEDALTASWNRNAPARAAWARDGRAAWEATCGEDGVLMRVGHGLGRAANWPPSLGWVCGPCTGSLRGAPPATSPASGGAAGVSYGTSSGWPSVPTDRPGSPAWQPGSGAPSGWPSVPADRPGRPA